MKKLVSCIALFSIAFLNAQEQLPINTSKSEIKWSCDYSFYFSGHFGIVQFQEGYFIKKDDMITGGSFTIDLNTLRAQDMNEEGNQSLTEHLKDPDFFDVKKYPTATLVITAIRYHDATSFEAKADMTIKGITQPVKFQAEIDFEKAEMTTKFKIDRTLWGVNYNSKLKDKAISDAIGFEVKLSL
ncbi:YceI family protein [Kordia sp. YSTF-M3]|uniref:YceI family protein n=1 Tax=Kordia aestuariivivens TaxID=2759037 RepID=A0ABR7QEG3_9FLAO|nr:YceI family protein [Kordia aestuariivivens]MBC8756960.1 YceI family protein [Kordia aestuariivivens]